MPRGVYKHRNSWWIDYTDSRGTRHRERAGPSQRLAVRAREARLVEIAAGRFGIHRSRQGITFREFVEGTWREEVLDRCKTSTKRGYDTALEHHLVPYFGDWRLIEITRPAVKSFIAQKRKQQRWSYSKKNPNPNRPTLARKTIMNMVSLLMSVLEEAVDYELIASNPLRGILKKRNFPADPLRTGGKPQRILEPEEFRRAVDQIRDTRVLRMVLVAALAGLRWGEQVAIRIDDEIDFRHNVIRITRAFYKRVPQTPKTEQSVRDIDMGPTVRRVMKEVPWTQGLVFSPDGVIRIGDGCWLRRQWRAAQLKADIKRPIRWHDLRHQFVSLLIAAGKNPLYIAQQAGHADAGFTLKRYGHLFKTIKPTPVEWPEDLLWPSGGDATVTLLGSKDRQERPEQPSDTNARSLD